VHASAVASGAIAAARRDCAGGRAYNLTEDFPLTVEGFVRYAGVGLSRRIWAPSIPSAAGSALFRALAVGVWAVGRPELSAHALGSLHWLTSDNPYTAARARCELGWRPTVTPDVGVPQAFRWWKTARRDTERAP
jgi:nucleoside-diphosphate-sugar epimerase